MIIWRRQLQNVLLSASVNTPESFFLNGPQRTLRIFVRCLIGSPSNFLLFIVFIQIYYDIGSKGCRYVTSYIKFHAISILYDVLISFMHTRFFGKFRSYSPILNFFKLCFYGYTSCNFLFINFVYYDSNLIQ